MKTIVHACSSVLTRPNGIVRYMNLVMDLQRAMGHKVIFITDAEPSQQMHSDEVVYENTSTKYVPHFKDGHVWLQVDDQVSTDVGKAYAKIATPDMVFCHDLHSYLGIKSRFEDGVFIQHESDVLHNSHRLSYISDQYMERQVNEANSATWRVGMVCNGRGIDPVRKVYLPVPFTPTKFPVTQKTRQLLYVGDSSDRKGASEFMDMARSLGIKPTVISHVADDEIFSGADVFSFGLAQQAQMFELMAECKAAYIPSKNECMSLAMLECLQFMPLVVDGQYEYAANMSAVGAKVVTGDINIKQVLLRCMSDRDPYYPIKLEEWARYSKQFWVNLST